MRPTTVGIWSAQVRTRGGLGAQMAFTEAGQVTSTFGALVDHKYEVDGSRITMTALNPHEPAPAPFSQEFTIDGDKLIFPQAKAQVMTRIGAPRPDAHPIIGDWSFTNQGHPGVARYSRSGVTQLTMPFVTHKGLYRVEGSTLHIQFDGLAPLALTITRDGDLLTTRDTNDKEIRFVKFNH